MAMTLDIRRLAMQVNMRWMKFAVCTRWRMEAMHSTTMSRVYELWSGLKKAGRD